MGASESKVVEEIHAKHELERAQLAEEFSSNGFAATLEKFAATIEGEVVSPCNGQRYNDIRHSPYTWNGHGKPNVIVLVANVEDCRKTIQFARSQKMRLSVAGGKHSITSMVDGTVLLDLEKFNSVKIDQNAKELWVGGGARLRDVDKVCQGTKLALPTGTNGDTGVGGLTLAGGWGWLARKYGLSCDHLLDVDILTADGSLLKASAQENKELFWGIKGGGGNFGIVLQFHFGLVDVPISPLNIMLVNLVLSKHASLQVIMNFAKFVKDAPDGFGGGLVLPAGAPVIPILGLYYPPEPVSTLADVPALSPLTNLGATFILQNKSQVLDHHKEVQCLLEQHQQPGFHRDSAISIYYLDEKVAEVLYNATSVYYPNRETKIIMGAMGGAIARKSEEDSAVPHRQSLFWLIVEGAWKPSAGTKGEEAVEKWIQRMKGELKAIGALQETSHAVEKEHSPAFNVWNETTLKRLQKLKTQYDPQNVFSLNRNITPLE